MSLEKIFNKLQKGKELNNSDKQYVVNAYYDGELDNSPLISSIEDNDYGIIVVPNFANQDYGYAFDITGLYNQSTNSYEYEQPYKVRKMVRVYTEVEWNRVLS